LRDNCSPRGVARSQAGFGFRVEKCVIFSVFCCYDVGTIP
jgi:hypothetical protein